MLQSHKWSLMIYWWVLISFGQFCSFSTRFSGVSAGTGCFRLHFLVDIVKFSAGLVIFHLVPCFLGGLVCFLAGLMVFQPVLWYFWSVLLAFQPVWWYFSLKTNLQCCLQSLCVNNSSFVSNWSLYDIYARAWGGVLKRKGQVSLF